MSQPYAIRHTEPRRPLASGTWVRGISGAYRFDALVFPEHAIYPEYELPAQDGSLSRISKLWIATVKDRTTVFNWDRGADQPAANQKVADLVEAITTSLAKETFGA